ncbi:ACP S-malonyltransferase [Streptomyces sp. Go40/10]|uniref:ACP S-malonyltransferase n=1 Tax=Streptomyces sp. Go40/10 TaxID=2825844 RepID=UPI001E524A58|nr:ACP S-malonyltransferase [Streptomyces sp. Go40/10]UFQ99883.1 ACP S-malonyltransferase [Streptomyces sp. Go40/10]
MAASETGWVFPGVEALSQGMLRELAAEDRVVTETFAEASEALSFDLWKLLQEGPPDQLNQLAKAEPAMLTAGVAAYRSVVRQGASHPAVVTGYGLGEYAALESAGVMTLKTAVRLVELRGQLMAEATAAGHGAVALIQGLEAADVRAICDEAQKNDCVSVSAYRLPKAVTIGGNRIAVERASELCKSKGARVFQPRDGVPANTLLMKPAAEKFAEAVKGLELKSPQATPVCNATGAVPADVEAIRQNIIASFYTPIQWTQCMKTVADQGVRRVLVLGGDGGLAQAVKQNGDFTTVVVKDVASRDQAAE